MSAFQYQKFSLFLKGALIHSCWECQLVQPLWKTVWGFLKKLGLELPYDPPFHFWVFTQRIKSMNSERYMHAYIHCSLTYNGQDMKTTWVPIRSWADKEYVVYRNSGLLLSNEEDDILPFAIIWMDLEEIMLSAISQTKYCMISFMWNLKNKQNKNKWTNRRKQTCICRDQSSGYPRAECW